MLCRGRERPKNRREWEGVATLTLIDKWIRPSTETKAWEVPAVCSREDLLLKVTHLQVWAVSDPKDLWAVPKVECLLAVSGLLVACPRAEPRVQETCSVLELETH